MSETRVIYLVGRAASGKSTLMRGLMERADLLPLPCVTPAKYVQIHDLLRERSGEVEARYLGKMREKFPGTDALGMSASPHVLRFLEDRPQPPVILAEGARLGTGKFFEGAINSGLSLTVVWVDAPGEIALQRARERGSDQALSWTEGTATRARTAYERAGALGADAIRLDGSQSREAVLGEAWGRLAKYLGEL